MKHKPCIWSLNAVEWVLCVQSNSFSARVKIQVNIFLLFFFYLVFFNSL